MKKINVNSMKEATKIANEILTEVDGYTETSSANCGCGETQSLEVYEYVGDGVKRNTSVVVCEYCAL